jgi:CheY-like chemotaxis protein/two-component sensor histidine kinase
MNAIIGMTNLLVKDDPREDQLEQLEILDFSAKTLLALINDVLDFSKIESGKIELEKISFDLHNLLNSVLESFRFTAEKKEISLKLKTGDELPRKVVGDPNRLTQILNNLVSNAVKFTDEGKVVVSVEKKEESQDQITLLFAVEDTGIGIASQKQEDIFESFTQERSDTSRMFGGTGLGLSISKKLVALQNGNMHLESEKGKGSTFYIELSFGIDEKSDDQKRSFSEQGKAVSLEGATVLLAEDNAINQKVMLRFLDKWKINPIVVEDGEEVLSALKNNKVHLVLMDLQMPKMDGYEATRKIRQLDDKKSEVPVVALTAAALTEVRDKVFDAGMDDYLTKPFNPTEMQKKLEYYILGDA